VRLSQGRKNKMKNNKVEGNKMKVEKMKKWLSAFLKDEEGASAIEYALMALMVAVGLITVSGDIRTAIQGTFEKIKTAVTSTP
jgi:pilus assembly protein Flp/PilA